MPFDGKKMARVRKAAGMIQLDLAKAVEINRVTVSDIERGKLQGHYAWSTSTLIVGQ